MAMENADNRLLLLLYRCAVEGGWGHYLPLPQYEIVKSYTERALVGGTASAG